MSNIHPTNGFKGGFDISRLRSAAWARPRTAAQITTADQKRSSVYSRKSVEARQEPEEMYGEESLMERPSWVQQDLIAAPRELVKEESCGF